jgi:RNA polymerase sigma factor (sigma-70 family)
MSGVKAPLAREFLSTLDRTERLILTLYYCEELTVHEVGLVLGISPTAVEDTLNSLVSRAREVVNTLTAFAV